jgi:carbon starvation protein
MNSLLIIIISFFGYIVAYRTYGKFIYRKLFSRSSGGQMPSQQFNDGVDFVPTRKTIIFGHHFTTIAGLGPIVGPAIGIIWGWLPALLWIFLGSIFMGAVHDFSSFIISARNRGKTIGELTGDIVSPFSRLVFQFIMQLLLFIVLAVFATIVATLFKMYPEAVIPVWFQIPIAVWLGWQIRKGKNELLYSLIALLLMYGSILLGVYFPVTIPLEGNAMIVAWCIILFIYVFFASTLPVQKLLQPRDYINSHQLLVAMSLMIIGFILARPEITAPAINQHAFMEGNDVPPLAPLMFIVIACGAISGFHSLASSGTTVKQVRKEEDGYFITYGGMLTESFLAVLVLMAIGGGLGMGLMKNDQLLTGSEAFYSHYGSWSSANGLGAKLDAFVTGTANLFERIGIPVTIGKSIVAVFIVSFANTTLDSAARIQRLSLQEIAKKRDGRTQKPFNNRYFSTLIIVVAAATLTFLKPGGQGAMLLWPLFGSLNQLLAALALGVVSIYLWQRKISIYYTFIPMMFVLLITIWGMIENLISFITEKDFVLIIISVLILILTSFLIYSGIVAMINRKN